jgi:hypothetical protein
VLVGVNDPTCYNCGRRNPGLWGFAPALRSLGNDLGFVNIVTGGTVIMYVLSIVMSREGSQIGISPKLGAAGPRRQRRVPVFGTAGGGRSSPPAGCTAACFTSSSTSVDPPARSGDRQSLWRGPDGDHLHLAGIVGFALSSVMDCCAFRSFGAPLTVGASASIFGFLGALVHYGTRTGSSHARQMGLQYALFMGIMGFVFSGVDNAAHLADFAGGYLASLILDPLKPERIDHIVGAVGCLVVTLAAIVYTVISALPYLR